ncbi:MAG: hypothetical protein KDJ43_09690 [Rhizobiaceae bacterium]|nr:hypothetical protein [Rhizobiaceae bacterium]MCP5475241.1 hypothetical protein [Rhodanobacteraceae bacterium]
MTDARLSHWRANPVPARRTIARFYAHGDEAEHAPGTFFCRRCDAFHRGEHFPLCAPPRCIGEVVRAIPDEPAENAWQLARSLYLIQARRARGDVIERTDDCASILTRDEKARAAAYVAYWRANPSKRWRYHAE